MTTASLLHDNAFTAQPRLATAHGREARISNSVSLHCGWAVALVVATACKGGEASGRQAPPPAAASNGAPMAFVVDKITPGPAGFADGDLATRAYNFSEKKIASYKIVVRYYDKTGAVLPVQVGTPFEKTFDTQFFAGRSYLCAPKTWCDLKLENLNVPAAAVKADILPTKLVTVAADGVKLDDKHPVFESPEEGWPGADKEPTKWPTAFADFGDAATSQAAWQGAWAGEGFGIGSTAAWHVAGEKMTFIDKAKGEQQFTLSIESPCSAGVGKTGGGWVNTYTLRNGELITGLGDAGYRKGNAALVCGGGSIWHFNGTACTRWDLRFRKWESAPATCGLRQEEGKDIFFYSQSDSETKVPIDGDTVWSAQLANTHAKKFPDFAAAKSAQGL